MHFLRAGVDKRLDAYKTPHSAATGQVDVVGGFKVVAAVILAQFCAETDGRYAVTSVIRTPLLVNVVELLGTDGVVRLETEVSKDVLPSTLRSVFSTSLSHSALHIHSSS